MNIVLKCSAVDVSLSNSVKLDYDGVCIISIANNMQKYMYFALQK